MNSPDDFENLSPELDAVESKLRQLNPRPAKVDWNVQATNDKTAMVDRRGNGKHSVSVLAVTWITGMLAGCLLMTAIYQPSTRQDTAINSVIDKTSPTERAKPISVNSVGASVAIAGRRSRYVASIIDGTTHDQLFSTSHLRSKPFRDSPPATANPKRTIDRTLQNHATTKERSKRQPRTHYQIISELLNEHSF